MGLKQRDIEIVLTLMRNEFNAYTGLAYKDGPDSLAFEINDEPPHNGSVEDVRGFVNTMAADMRETGLRLPIGYSMSHNSGVTEAFLTAEIEGGTFQWYPTGPNEGFTQRAKDAEDKGRRGRQIARRRRAAFERDAQPWQGVGNER